MTAILTAAYVFGLWHVIRLWMEFFGFDGDHFYLDMHFKEACYTRRPLWQKFILKPLYYCMPCMCSIHGTFCYFVLIGGTSITEWIWTVIVAAGILVLVNRVMGMFEV